MKKWNVLLAETAGAAERARREELPLILAELLEARGIHDTAALLGENGLLSDPLQMADMQKAAQRIWKALESFEKIAVYGDYDVDGVTATSILYEVISSYSHGMRQKLALCAAFVHEPRLLLLDEPFVGLDPKAAHTCKQLMRALCARGGAIFFSTHVLEVAQTLCDRVAIIQNGRLLVEGETQTVCRDESLESVFLELTEDA